MKKLIIILIFLILLIGIECGFGQPIIPGGTWFFKLLHDTPNTYTSQADKILQVNAGETAIEFTSLADIEIAMGINLVENTALSTWIDTFAELNAIVADKTLVNEEDAATWDSLHQFTANVTLTKVGNSPVLSLIDGDSKYLAIQKLDAGSALIINNEGSINIVPSNDLNDYLSISTASGIVTITTNATDDGDLVITAAGGEIGFGDENLSTTGTFEAATITEGGIAVHNNDEMDASSELAAIIDDETGTGNIVFNTSPTFANTMSLYRSNDTASVGFSIDIYRDRDGDPTSDVSSGDYLGIMDFRGYHTDGYDHAATIQAIVDNTPGNGDMPTRLEFLTSADGSATPTLRMTIDSNGRVGIGAVNPSEALELRVVAPLIRLRATGSTASDTAAYVEFGGTTSTAWNRTGYVGDSISGDTHIRLRAEDSDLILGDSSGASVLTLSGGDVTATGNVEGATLTEGGNAVPNATDHLGFFGGTTSAELLAEISNETGSGVLVFGTAPTFTTSITITGADASPSAAGQIRYDNSVAGVDGGALVWYDDDEVKHLMDYVTAPTDAEDDYHLAYDKDTDLMYWKSDADSGGSTKFDAIGDPDGAGSVSFADTEVQTFSTAQNTADSFLTIDNTVADVTNNVYLLDLDYSVDDNQANADYLKCQDAGGVVFSIQENGKIVITPGGVGSLDVISATPSTAISTNEAIWNAIVINGAALDPSGDDILLCGVNVDMSGVVFGGTGGDIDGIGINMADGEEHAIHISQGKFVAENTVAATAGAEFTIFDIQIHTASMNANSSIHAIDVATPETPAGTVVAVGTHSNVEVIQQSIGTFSTPNQNEYAGKKHTGGTAWIDGDTGGGAEDLNGNEIFVVDDDEIYVGSTAQFSEIDVIMTTPGSKTVTPTFHYNTAADTWTEFFPADDTDGFQQNGVIRWTLGDISGSWTNNGDPGGGDSSAGYWIKIIRTANADPGTPTPTTVKTGLITSYFWDKTGAIDVLSLEADTITEGGIAVHNNDEMDASSELAAIIDDETGTGLIVFNDSPTLGTQLTLNSNYGDGATHTNFVVFERKRDGTPTDDVSSGDYLAIMNFKGYHTDGYDSGVAIRAIIDNTPGNGDMPSSLLFLTSPDASATPVLRMTIDSAGDIELGADDNKVDLTIHHAGVLTLYDASDDTLVSMVVGDGTTVLGVTGTINATALQEGGVAVITEADMPAAGADPDVDAAGEIGRDTDGANETGDSSLRGHDGAAQFLYAAKIKYLDFTLIEPDQIDAYDLIPIWLNTTGMTATFLEWHGFSDDDNVSLEFECLTDRTDFTAITTMDAVEIATDGTGVYYASDATWTSATVAHDDLLAVDFDGATDTPDYVKLSTSYWLNSDID